MLTLDNSDPGKPLLLHDEPIYCEGKIIGETTSGNYSFNYKKNMALGYLNLIDSKKELQKKQFQIEVAKTKYDSTLQLKALHDPKNIGIWVNHERKNKKIAVNIIAKLSFQIIFLNLSLHINKCHGVYQTPQS